MDLVDEYVLSDMVSEEFGYEANAVDGKVVVTENFSAGFWCIEQFEEFEEQIREFVLQYTEGWSVEDASFNRIEGYHRAVLVED